MSIIEEKQQLRKQAKLERSQLDESLRDQEQVRIDEHLLSIAQDDFGTCAFAAYMSTNNEVSCAMLIHYLWSNGEVVYLPRVSGERSLSWHAVANRMQLEMGAYNILEPNNEASALPEDLILFVPGLAFSADGSRLGMGGGFYDQVLANLPQTSKSIGLAWNSQLQEHIPTEPHDAVVNGIITAADLYGDAAELLGKGSG